MSSYVIELSEDLSRIYEDIAKLNHKKTEECLSIILERVIRTMLRSESGATEPPYSNE